MLAAWNRYPAPTVPTWVTTHRSPARGPCDEAVVPRKGWRTCRSRIVGRCLFAKKACGLGSLPVTAALLACAELAGVRTWLCTVACFSPPLRRRPDRRSPQPAEAGAEAFGHYGNDQPRGLGMVTHAGSQLAANGGRSHTRVTFEGTADRLPDIANSGLPPESGPGIVRVIRHALKDRETSGREGNIRRNHLEVGARPWPPAAGPGAVGSISAYARESTAACHPAARCHSLKRTSRHAVPDS
jgi:hypothetical protein